MAAVETRTVQPDEAGMRLDRWFKHHFPGLGFGDLQKLVRTGQVRVDGGRVKTSSRVEPGQVVRVPPLAVHAGENPPDPALPRVKSESREAEDRAFLDSITLYKDAQVMVLNKPHGLAVQGGSGLTRHVDGLLECYRDSKGQKPRLVHRIDRDTSGILVIARTRLAASKLAESFRSRHTKKVYWALVAGVPKPRQGRVSTFLARGEGDGPEGERMRIARHGDEDASHALTFYAVVDQAGQKLSWLSMRPVTGRTHQLRAHAAHIGHPIVGDPKYFDILNWELPGGLQNKLHLHARRIIMPHPAGGTLDVSAPLPLHMQQSWNLLGFDASVYDPIEESPDE